MVTRSPGPGRYRWLEWGPDAPGAGGGSRVRDAVDAPVRTGSRVVSISSTDPVRVGTVAELLDVDSVRIRWDSGHGTLDADPKWLRVIG